MNLSSSAGVAGSCGALGAKNRQKGLFLRLDVFNEFERVIPKDIGDVPILETDPFAVHIQPRVVVSAFAVREGHPVIELRAGVAVPGIGVFSDQSRVVSLFVQMVDKSFFRKIFIGVVERTMGVRVHAGQNTAAAGTAQRRGDISVIEGDAFIENPRLCARHVLHRVVTLVVSKDDDEVGSFILCQLEELRIAGQPAMLPPAASRLKRKKSRRLRFCDFIHLFG